MGNLDLVGILCDPNNNEDITLTDDKGNSVAFQQVATIPYQGEVYCFLAPLANLVGVKQGEAILFHLQVSNDDECNLVVERDLAKIKLIYDEYLKLTKEEQ